MAVNTQVVGFPQSSDELDQWKAQGRFFSGGKWFEGQGQLKVTTPDIEAGLKEVGKGVAELQKEFATFGGEPIQETTDFTMPTPVIDTPDITNANSAIAREKASLDARAKQIEREIAEANKSKPDLLAISEEIAGLPTREEKAETEFEKLGISPEEFFKEQTADVAGIESLLNDFNKAEAVRDKLIADARGQAVVGGIVDTNVQRITNEENLKLNQISGNINTQLALREMKNGNFDQARSFVQSAIVNFVADKKYEVDRFNAFVEQNQDAIDDLSKEYRDILEDTHKTNIKALEDAEDEMEWVGDAFINPKYTGANILMTDSKREAQKKINAFLKTQPQGDILSVSEAKSLGVPFGTTEQQAFGITPKTTTGGDDAQRVANARATIMARRGADFLISRETYAEMATDWIAQGGTTSDFKTAFPPESLMNQGNINALPQSLKPKAPAEDILTQIIRGGSGGSWDYGE